MNTSDIRNLNDGQWVFWATSIPFSAAGLLLWLAYLGTLQNWWKAVSGMFKKSKRDSTTRTTPKSVVSVKHVLNGGNTEKLLP
jgi:hypothetical protein